MEGHYYVEVEDEDLGEDELNPTFNCPRFDDALAAAAASGKRVIKVGFACTYGCGVLHRLTDEEMLAMRARPGLSVAADVMNGDPPMGSHADGHAA